MITFDYMIIWTKDKIRVVSILSPFKHFLYILNVQKLVFNNIT